MRGLRLLLAVLLALEALNSVLWSSRILSAAAAYDVVVLGMVLARIVVSALQGASAWMLMGRALPAITFARLAFGLSAVLLVFEVGLRLSPSGLQPGLRMPIVMAYVLYASSCIGALNRLERADSAV